MPHARFVHLRLHSEYSITDGLTRLDGAVARAAADGMPALALTDLSNLFGMVKFYTAARGAGVKPIIGADVWITEENESALDGGRETPSRLLLLAKNRVGYLRLCELLTAAFLRPRRHGRAEIPRSAFAAGDNSGLIVLAGAQFGEIGLWLAADKPEKAAASARAWAETFPQSFYLEIQRPHGSGSPQGRSEYVAQERLLAATLRLAAELDLPVVATHPVQFLDADDFRAHEARVCIAEGYVLGDRRRPQNFNAAQYFKTQDEMAALFADLPEALANSVEIAQRCNLTVELGKNRLPEFPIPPGVSLEDYLAEITQAGLEKRLAQLYPDPETREAERPRYAERLAFEIKTIVQMGFPGYFLIVADFINWGKTNGVPVGPGRGSGAGSLVAYSLNITDLDPLRYELLFERFLNPERVSMPDFDIDFCQEGRDRVIDYVRQRYGSHAVSQIATFGTMAAKAVIRDVGRVLDLGFNFVDQFAKLIPNELGITLVKAREQEPAINERLEQEEELRELWTLAEKLEGLTRNVGMHAGGVLIAPGKLTDFCPLYSADGGATVSQFDKDDVEKAGLVKFDFLGLRTLTILAEAVVFVKEVEGVDIALDNLPLDDAAVYADIFKAANTTAVFQFESRGMKDTLVQARPDCLEDLIALNALYRPGPMDFIPNFINRKHGRERVVYPHPSMEKVLGNTYGIMVYQEQVMQTAQVVAGYSLGGADLLRRAMGKKKLEEMAEQREIFVAGAATNGIAAPKANEIFDTMEKFAGYGFNKSHAAAYSLVAYQTAWLKRHYPAAFMAATLSSETADTDKVQFFFLDAQANGISFLPPDINTGFVRFRPVDAKTIRYGLGALKGTGEAALAVILRAREAGPFIDLFEFCRRVDKRAVNRRVIESLIRAGAFDSVDDHRAKLLASVSRALEAADQAERHAHQGGLFDAPDGAAPQETHYVDVPRWSEREQLLNEKQALGFFLSGHPYNAYAEELKSFVRRRLVDLEPQREPTLLAGVVLGVRTQMTRRGKMAIVTLDDASAQVEIAVYNELWDAERNKIREDELLLVEGKVQRDDYSGGLRVTADKLMTLAEARGRHARVLKLALNGTSSDATAGHLRTLLGPYRGAARASDNVCPVRICYRNAAAETELTLPDSWRVRLDDTLLTQLSDWLSRENVRVIYG
ncbi:MAG: DNA polymerase III subunit alpha [Gammaproteobacteria bacterium]|nr:DNA polymerase III subunit alpha [Rhodocyclaceae bacterium]MBU3908302.1 DNA polymerase III subunit alpha [Gammaproteobacteria bacterium]MBU3988736.1 DNA polymerase III subunit alpha [Gammaproteobacteria bacterium]MBU4003061.1 DNA polymerase III subunit alpha [Gammaproteobacteria bacterium]MBU4019903.1 DNA polymerase III subunit alpha [Gammaproteobacteria bacterium]